VNQQNTASQTCPYTFSSQAVLRPKERLDRYQLPRVIVIFIVVVNCGSIRRVETEEGLRQETAQRFHAVHERDAAKGHQRMHAQRIGGH